MIHGWLKKSSELEVRFHGKRVKKTHCLPPQWPPNPFLATDQRFEPASKRPLVRLGVCKRFVGGGELRMRLDICIERR